MAMETKGNDLCQYHMQDHAVMEDLKGAIKVIIDGQQDMRGSLIQLTEAFKNMGRIERKIERLEAERIRKVELQDKEIRELRTFMNRALGWGASAMVFGGIALKFLGV